MEESQRLLRETGERSVLGGLLILEGENESDSIKYTVFSPVILSFFLSDCGVCLLVNMLCKSIFLVCTLAFSTAK